MSEKKPIQGAKVEVYKNEELVDYRYTNSNGRCDFFLPEDTYTVKVTKEGYLPHEQTVTLNQDIVKEVELRPTTGNVSGLDPYDPTWCPEPWDKVYEFIDQSEIQELNIICDWDKVEVLAKDGLLTAQLKEDVELGEAKNFEMAPQDSVMKVKRFAICCRKFNEAGIFLANVPISYFEGTYIARNFHALGFDFSQQSAGIAEYLCLNVVNHQEVPIEDKWYVALFDLEQKIVRIYDENKTVICELPMSKVLFRRMCFWFGYIIELNAGSYPAGYVVGTNVDWIALKFIDLPPIDPHFNFTCPYEDYDNLWEFTSQSELEDFANGGYENTIVEGDCIIVGEPEEGKGSVLRVDENPYKRVVITFKLEVQNLADTYCPIGVGYYDGTNEMTCGVVIEPSEPSVIRLIDFVSGNEQTFEYNGDWLVLLVDFESKNAFIYDKYGAEKASISLTMGTPRLEKSFIYFEGRRLKHMADGEVEEICKATVDWTGTIMGKAPKLAELSSKTVLTDSLNIKEITVKQTELSSKTTLTDSLNVTETISKQAELSSKTTLTDSLSKTEV
mgnify:CR=1 FL=1